LRRQVVSINASSITINIMSDIATTLHNLANRLPASASWDDVCYEVELLASIDRGIQQANALKGLNSDALLAALGLA
jgi:hypothetical protein